MRRRLRTLALSAAALTGLELVLTGGRRHDQLIERLDQLLRSIEELGALGDDVGALAGDVTSPPSELAAVLYGPGTSKVAVIRSDGSRTIHASAGAKWDQVAAVARLVPGVDVDELEARMFAQHKGVREVRYLPPKQVHRAVTKLLDQLTTTPTTAGTR